MDILQKQPRYENKKITQSARARNCTINLPGCNYNPETVVYCHLNGAEFGKGMGIKADDGMGFYGCSHCHDLYDGRIEGDFEREWMEFRAFRAALRTVRILIRERILK
jgi:hypothetical protein